MYTWEEYFNQSWITYCNTKTAYYIAISFGGLSYGTLCKYWLIVYSDLISFPHKLDALFMYCIYKIIIYILLSWLVFSVPIVILMTCCISTLLDLWNTEWMNEWMNSNIMKVDSVNDVVTYIQSTVFVTEIKVFKL